MAYETLITSSVLKASKKPNYTPMKSMKKLVKFFLRRMAKKSQQKHEKFSNDLGLDLTFQEQFPSPQPIQEDIKQFEESFGYGSEEESENYENERLEAEATRREN